MIPIFLKNYKQGLKEDDLYEPLNSHRSEYLGERLENIWKKQNKRYKKSALHRALFRLFQCEIVVIGIIQFAHQLILILVQPLSIGGFINYFQSENSLVSKEEAYLYAGLIILCFLIDGIVNHPVMMAMMHTAMKMRVSCSSLIYRKCLRLSGSALAETTTGQIVNLLSNDVSKFDQDFILCHYLWIAPIQAIIGTYLLYRVIGVSAFSGVVFILLFIPLQMYVGKWTSVFRLRTAARTDERIRLMNEILSGIQVIKMNCWEKPFAALIGFARRYEMKAIRANFFLQAIIAALDIFLTRTSVFITIIVFVSLGNTLKADTAYTIVAIYNILRPVVIHWFSNSITSLAEVHISISRIQKFLNCEELLHLQARDVPKESKLIFDRNNKIGQSSIMFNNVTAKWSGNSPENTLSSVNLAINENQLIAVIGPVGSGKSSLFNVILKELSISEGSMHINGKISYMSQEAWLFSANVRQNILFGDVYEEDRYRAVVKICALEADLATLPYGDRTIVGEKGKKLSGGQKARINLARCIYKRADIYLLDDPLSAVDTKVGKQLYENCIEKFLCKKICVLITHQLQYLQSVDKIIILREGKVVGEGDYNELQTSGLDFAKLLQEFCVSKGNEDEDRKKINSRQNSEVSEEKYDGASVEIIQENMDSGRVSSSVYRAYLKAGGNYIFMALVFLAFVAAQAGGNVTDYFISYWVNLEQDVNEKKESDANVTVYEKIDHTAITYTYSVIILITIVMALTHSILYFIFFTRASVTLHDKIFDKIARATMRFFNCNPTGRILNRFSKYIGTIDEYIPFIISDVLEIILLLAGTIILTCIVSPWLLIPSTILLLLFYFLRLLYLETSRNVKRIEGITYSPILNHTTASLNGLTTIRAFYAERTLIQEFDSHQNHHSSAWYLFISASRAFGYWLDLTSSIFISLIVISFLLFDTNYYGGDIGLIITQYLGLAIAVQWGIRQISELENNMTSVERVLEYTKVETEPIRKQISTLPKDWPEFGKIVFQNVSMKYHPNDPLILKELNFTIYSKEKVGVVGRTGAGKTSIIAALYQLYDTEGSIFIDGIDITKLALADFRSKLSVIPQDPVLFSGTIRKNLDLFEEYSDEVLWDALEQVELKTIISEMPAGLNSNVSESGSNFSIGQRQLICLARAIVGNNKILILDEATANVDPYTDALIQKTIRKRFSGCTVMTVAHRLHTVIDCDRVLVVDSGEVVEFDHPYKLLQNADGLFYTMVRTTGEMIFNRLLTLAEKSFREQEDT